MGALLLLSHLPVHAQQAQFGEGGGVYVGVGPPTGTVGALFSPGAQDLEAAGMLPYGFNVITGGSSGIVYSGPEGTYVLQSPAEPTQQQLEQVQQQAGQLASEVAAQVAADVTARIAEQQAAMVIPSCPPVEVVCRCEYPGIGVAASPDARPEQAVSPEPEPVSNP